MAVGVESQDHHPAILIIRPAIPRQDSARGAESLEELRLVP
jgi:hypothetical protein